MAKAPIPGFAKTRLIPALGAAGAARLQRELTRRTVSTALRARLGPVTLWCTPDARARFFRALSATTGVRCLVQASGDLGDRMHTAFRLQCVHGPLLVIGTDCPALHPAHLRAAAMALRHGKDVVLCPADDGGYVLIGLRQPQPALFHDMPWSTPSIHSETLSRAQAEGLEVCELKALWDVDVPADLERLRRLDATGRRAISDRRAVPAALAQEPP